MNQDKLQVDLEYVTQKRPLSSNESLVEVLARLDEVSKEADLPKQLEHYLSKRSYLKALEWLAEPSTPHHR